MRQSNTSKESQKHCVFERFQNDEPNKEQPNDKNLSVLESVIRFNNMAVSLMEDGCDYEKGEMSLQCALSELKKLGESTTHKITNTSGNAKRMNEIINFFSHSYQTSILGNFQSNQKNGKVDDDNNDEYDEGMSTFSGPVRLENFLECHEVLAMTIYNLGQVHVRLGNENISEDIFSFALGILLQSSTRDEDTAERKESRRRRESFCAMMMMAALHNIGRIQYNAKKYECSMSNYFKALHIGRECLGFRHEYVAATLNCLGVVHLHSNMASKEKNDQTMKLFREALAIRKSTLEKKHHHHTDIATMLNNIGRLHFANGDFVKALDLYNEVLQMRISLLGKDSIDVAVTTCNLGEAYGKLEKNNQALEMYKEFLRIAQDKLGSNRWDVAIAHKRMAEIHHKENRYDEALELYKKALEIGRAAFGNDHAEIGSILNRMGNAYYEKSDFGSALKAYEEGLEVERAVLSSSDGNGHTNLIVTMKNIGRIHRTLGDYEQAVRILSEAYCMEKCALSPNQHDLSVMCETLSDIGLILYLMGNYARSFDVYKECLRLRREMFGSDDNNVKVAAILNSIGMVLFKQGLMQAAMESLVDGLKMRISLLGDDHSDVAVSLFNIATVLYEQGNEDEAMKYYKQTLRVERAALGKDHEDVVFTLQSLGNIHEHRGELEEALRYFQESLEIEQNRPTDRSEHVAKILNRMGNLHLQRGNVSEAMGMYSEALRLSEMCVSIYTTKLYMLSKLHPECAAAA